MKNTAIHSGITYRSAFRKYILDIFSGIRTGQLIVTLPDSETLSFGNTTSKPLSINIHDEKFFDKCFLHGDIGFGESYVEGHWSTDDLTELISLMIDNLAYIPGISGSRNRTFIFNLFRGYNRIIHLFRANSVNGSKKNIQFHYDLSNDFFKTFLDQGMTYSSAYFTSADMKLEEAQLEKYKRLWAKLALNENDHVLEIGCGWGTNAIEMAQRFGCRVTAITISEEQYKEASSKVQAAGLSDKVSIKLIDYRKITGTYTKIISIEMLEAVGHEYLGIYFQKISDLLAPGGIVGLQVITCPDSRYKELKKGTDWIQKHIFPGTLLPSVGIINEATSGNTNLTLVDMKDLGLHYSKTLNIWNKNFNDQKEQILGLGFDEEFIRKWNYYFSYCEAAFAKRNINVMQMIYSVPNNPNYA